MDSKSRRSASPKRSQRSTESSQGENSLDLETMSTISSEATMQITLSDYDGPVSETGALNSGSELEEFVGLDGEYQEVDHGVHVLVWLFGGKGLAKMVKEKGMKLTMGVRKGTSPRSGEMSFMPSTHSLDDYEKIEHPMEQHEMIQLDNSPVWHCKLFLESMTMYEYSYFVNNEVFDEFYQPFIDPDTRRYVFDVSRKFVQVGEEPFKDVWYGIISEWQKNNSDMSLYLFLQQYSGLLYYTEKKWPKVKVAISHEKIEEVVSASLSNIVKTGRLAQSLGSVVLLGSISMKCSLSESILQQLMFTFLNEQMRSISIREEIPELQYLDWIAHGMKKIYDMKLPPKIRYLWVAASHFLREIEPFSGEVPHSTPAFIEACKIVHSTDSFSPKFAEIQSTWYIFSQFIDMAPSFEGLFLLLEITEDEEKLFSDQIVEKIRAKIISLDKTILKEELTKMEGAGEDISKQKKAIGSQLFSVIQSNARLQTQNVLCSLFQTSLVEKDPDLGIKILQLVNTKVVSFTNYELFQSWFKGLAKDDTLSFQNLIRYTDAIIRATQEFLGEKQLHLLDNILLSSHFNSPRKLFQDILASVKDSHSTQLQEFLKERCQVIINGLSESEEIIETFKLITTESTQAPLLQNEILYHFMDKFKLEPDQGSVLERPIWVELIPVLAKSNLESCKKRFQELKQEMSQIRFRLKNKSMSFKIVAWVLRKSTVLLELSQLMGGILSKQELGQYQKDHQYLSDSIEYLLTFFSNYCGSKEAELQVEEIVELRQQASGHSFGYVQSVTNNILSDYKRTELKWLYDLRSTESFLAMWKEYLKDSELSRPRDIGKQIILKAKKGWMNLYQSFNNNSITFEQVQKHWFGVVPPSRYEKELKRLYSQRKPGEKLQIDSAWIKRQLDLITMCDTYRHFGKQIPSILQLANVIKENFQGDLTEDATYLQAQDFYATVSGKVFRHHKLPYLSRYQALLTLSSVLTKDQMDFFSRLSKLEFLVKWLLKMKSGTEFRNLVDICKSYTDNIKIVSTLNSLIKVRNSVSCLINPEKPLKNFRALYDEMGKGNITRESIEHLDRLEIDFPNLVRVFEEKTKSPGILALFELQELREVGEFVVSQDGIFCQTPDEQHSLEKLMDLRNKLILAEIPTQYRDDPSDPSEESISPVDTTFPSPNVAPLQPSMSSPESTPSRSPSPSDLSNSIVNLYVHQIPVLERIYTLWRYLIDQGHFRIQFQRPYQFSMTATVEKLKETVKRLEAEKKFWKIVIRDVRDTYYTPNFFTMRQMVKIHQLLVDQENNDDECLQLLRYGHINLSGLELKEKIASVWNDGKDHSADTPSEKLMRVTHFLEEIFKMKSYQKSFRSWENDKTSDEAPDFNLRPVQAHLQNHLRNTAFWEKLSTHNFCIVSQPSYGDVFDSIMTIYSYQNRFPCPDEVHLCQSDTSIEELIIMINRWFYSSRIGRETAIYCIANIDFLPYPTQARILIHLNQLLMSKGNAERASLVLLSGSQKKDDSRHLLTVLSQYVVDLFPLGSTRLQEILEWGSVRICQFTRVYSELPGSGKTEHILKSAHANKMEYHRIPIRQNSTSAELLATLRKAKGVRPKLFHLDLCPFPSQSEAMLFFQLCYLGVLQDSESIYYPRPEDRWMIEEANTDQQGEKGIFSKLPSHCCEVTKELLSFENFKVKETQNSQINLSDPSSFEINVNRNKNLEECCRFLLFFETKKLGAFFEKMVNKTPTQRRSFHLLRTYSESNTFSAFQRMANVLYQYIQSFKQGKFYFKMANSEFEQLAEYAIQSAKQFAVSYIDLKAADRFQNHKTWTEISKDLRSLVFSRSFTSGPLEMELIGLNPEVLKGQSKRPTWLKETSFLKKHFPFSTVTPSQARKLMQSIFQTSSSNLLKSTLSVNSSNLLMLLYIATMLKHNIPCLLLADSGVGKSETIKFVCSSSGIDFQRISLHGGHSAEDIQCWMEPYILKAKQNPEHNICLFLDQLNSATCMGFLKSLICDRINGEEILPDNIKLLAACSPYRARANIHGIEHEEIDVYKVHSLPDSLVAYVIDFGEWNQQVERTYVQHILEAEMKYVDQQKNWQFLKEFTDLILHCHAFIRKTYEEASAVSLRDVKRTIRICSWFNESYRNREEEEPTSLWQRTVLLAIGHCYYYRLNNAARVGFEQHIEQFANQSKLFQNMNFKEILIQEQEYFTSNLRIPSGIALNSSLRENIFMIIISVLNRIPIFIIGKSGTSKSLAMEVVRTNLKGKASTNHFLKTLPNVEVFVYSCSRLSKGEGIEQTFAAARKFDRSASDDTITVVLLNEVGLLEQSDYFPVKVLYKELNNINSEIAIVGLSNFQFDVSIINRVVFLSKPPPQLSDLQQTLKSILSSQQLHSTLPVLAKAYEIVYRNQTKWHLRMDYFGLRDFYATIKFLNERLEEFITPDLLSQAIRRNFGGIPSAMYRVTEEFFNHMGWEFDQTKETGSVLKPIEENLKDQNARNLMLLSENNAALQLLFDHLLDHEEAIVIFGDQKKDSAHMLMNLQRVKNCMSEGKTIVLINCHMMYESLYDLFNMSFTEYDGNRFVSLAMGTHSRQCLVHPNFRAILVVEKHDAMKRLAIPLLNRFEKQSLMPQDLILEEKGKKLLQKLKLWEQEFRTGDHRSFAGEHSNLIESLVVYLLQNNKDDVDSLYMKGVEEMLWISTADAIVRTGSKFGRYYTHRYFENQEHSSLAAVLERMHQEKHLSLQVLTYCPASMSVRDFYQNNKSVKVHSLQRLGSRSSTTHMIHQFFRDSNKTRIIFQCDMSVVSQLQIQEVQYLYQRISKEYGCQEKQLDKMIVFLIHIHPCQKPKFFVHFTSEWKSVFVDELSNVEPTLKSLLNEPLSEHIDHLNIRDLVLNNFRSSLSSLKYSMEVNITHKINILNQLLLDDTFWKELEPTIKKTVKKRYDRTSKLYWSEKVASNIQNHLPISGNYFRAVRNCVERMVLKAFTNVLAFLDQNGNMDLLPELLQDQREDFSFWMNLADLASASDDTVDVSQKFQAKFPFSFIICPIIKQMRGICQSAPSGIAVSLSTYLNLKWPSLNVATSSLNNEYLHDYLCLTQTSGTQVSTQDQFKIAKVFMRHQNVSNIVGVQEFIWKEEKRLSNAIGILEAMPKDMVSKIIDQMTSVNETLPDEIMFNAISELLGPLQLFSNTTEKMDPSQFISDARDWIQNFTRLEDYIYGFVLCTKDPNIRNERIRMWKVLYFFKEYLTNFILVDGKNLIANPKSSAQSFIEMLNQNVSSVVLFKNVYHFLKRQYDESQGLEMTKASHSYLQCYIQTTFKRPHEPDVGELLAVLVNVATEKDKFCGLPLSDRLKRFIFKLLISLKSMPSQLKTTTWKHLSKAIETSLDKHPSLLNPHAHSLFFCLLAVYEETYQSQSLLGFMKSVTGIDSKYLIKRTDLKPLVQQIALIKVGVSTMSQILYAQTYHYACNDIQNRFPLVFCGVIQKFPARLKELVYRRVILYLIQHYGQCTATEVLASTHFSKLTPFVFNTKSLTRSLKFYIPYNDQLQTTVEKFKAHVEDLPIQPKSLEHLLARARKRNAIPMFLKAFFLSLDVLAFHEGGLEHYESVLKWVQDHALDEAGELLPLLQKAPPELPLFGNVDSLVDKHVMWQIVCHLAGLSLLCQKSDFPLIWMALNRKDKLDSRYVPGSDSKSIQEKAQNQRNQQSIDSYMEKGIHFEEVDDLFYQCRDLSPLATRILRLIVLGYLISERYLMGDIEQAETLSSLFASDYRVFVQQINKNNQEAANMLHFYLQDFGRVISPRGRSDKFRFLSFSLKIPKECLEFEVGFNHWVEKMTVAYYKKNPRSSSVAISPIQYLYRPVMNPEMESLSSPDSKVWESPLPLIFSKFQTFLFSKSRKAYPLLFQVFSNHQTIQTFKHIIKVREFYSALFAQYQGKIDLNFAQTHSIQDFQTHFEPRKQQVMVKLFKLIQNIWPLYFGGEILEIAANTTLEKVLSNSLIKKMIVAHNSILKLDQEQWDNQEKRGNTHINSKTVMFKLPHTKLSSRTIQSDAHLIRFDYRQLKDIIQDTVEGTQESIPSHLQAISDRVSAHFFQSKPILIDEEPNFEYLPPFANQAQENSVLSMISQDAESSQQVPLPENKKTMIMEEIKEGTFNLEQMILELTQCFLFINRESKSLQFSNVMPIRYFALEYLLFDKKKSELLQSNIIPEQKIEHIHSILKLLQLLHVPVDL